MQESTMGAAGGLSVVIPAYNEAQGISGTIAGIRNALAGIAMPYDIIVVDDGSADGTSRVLAAIEGLIVVRHATNAGYGASLKDGILRSERDLICIVDADGTYPVNMIPALLAQMEDFDMAVCARTGGRVSESLHRRAGKAVLIAVSSLVTGRRIPDLNSGMRMFRKKDALRFFKILPEKFSFTTTITLAYLCNGLTVGYVPIDYYPRIGTSKIRPIRDGLKFLTIIVRVITRFRPLRIFIPASALLLLLGLVVLSVSAYMSTPTGIALPALIAAAAVVALLGLVVQLTMARSAP